MNGPDGIAIDSAGNIYIVDTFSSRVQKFDSDMNFLLMWGWGVKDHNPGPQICTKDDSVCYGGIVRQYNNTFGSDNGQFWIAHGIAIDTKDTIYVSDQNPVSPQGWTNRQGNVAENDNRIEMFDTGGNYLGQFGTYGSGDGQLNQPFGMLFDSSGKLLVTDARNNRIQVFSAPSSIATINPQGIISTRYLKVSNSTNAGSAISCAGCTDAGGNTNWTFTAPPAPESPTAPASISGNGTPGGMGAGGGLPFTLTPPRLQTVYPDGHVVYLDQTPNTNHDGQGQSPFKLGTGSLINPQSQTAITSLLKLGSRGTPVTVLQTILHTLGMLLDEPTGYFGSHTEAALKQYQQSQSLDPVGYTGPNTREALKRFISAQTQKSDSSVVSVFTKDLRLGDTDSEAKLLQIYLNTHGYIISATGAGTPGNETDYFGQKTAQALTKLQKASGITPASGFLGPKTRTYINEHH